MHARQEFRAARKSEADTLSIIKTETDFYPA
jgi:hypothetical protein